MHQFAETVLSMNVDTIDLFGCASDGMCGLSVGLQKLMWIWLMSDAVDG